LTPLVALQLGAVPLVGGQFPGEIDLGRLFLRERSILFGQAPQRLEIEGLADFLQQARFRAPEALDDQGKGLLPCREGAEQFVAVQQGDLAPILALQLGAVALVRGHLAGVLHGRLGFHVVPLSWISLLPGPRAGNRRHCSQMVIQSRMRNNSRTSLALKPRSYRPRTSRRFLIKTAAG